MVDEFRQMAAVGERLMVSKSAGVKDGASSGVTSAVNTELAWLISVWAAGSESRGRVG